MQQLVHFGQEPVTAAVVLVVVEEPAVGTAAAEEPVGSVVAVDSVQAVVQQLLVALVHHPD